MWKLYVWLLGYLSVETGSDIRKKEISVISSFICGSAALLLRIAMGLLRPQADAVQFLLTAILPGCVLLLIGKITRQEIGYGDREYCFWTAGLWPGREKCHTSVHVGFVSDVSGIPDTVIVRKVRS